MEELEFAIGFDGEPAEKFDLVAYAFSQGGELIEAVPVRDGRFRFKHPANMLRHARVLIAPAPEKGRAQPTLEELERAQAYEPALPLRGASGRLELAPIPSELWRWWPRCRCRVRGRVVRTVTIGGVTHQLPVCHARVHICEVDRLPRLIIRLPDLDLFGLRDDLLRLIEIPVPPIPIPDPPPFRFDPGMLDPSPERIADLNRAGLVGFDPQPDPPAETHDHLHAAGHGEVMLNPQPLPPRFTVALNPQPEPPGLQLPGDVLMFNPQPDPPRIAALAPELRAAIASGSAPIVRAALLENIALLRPILCWLPWLRYWFTCDELRVVHTDHQGRCDVTISYPCFGDRPDLYFWVEYCLGGVWTTVYHPPIPCNTYWNFACGSEVTIQISDPRVPWCEDPSPLPGLQLAVLTIGNGVSTSEIQLSAAGAAYGLTSDGRPFGGSLEPHVWFGSGLIPAGITHYRWSQRRLGSSGDWTALDRHVVRHYAEIAPDDTLTFKPFPLGPDPAFPAATLFKIQPESSPGDNWAPMVDARENTASAFFLSHLLEAGNAAAGAGKYELKLELFRADGTQVNLTDAGIAVKEATDPAPFGPTTVHTTLAPNERVIKDGAGKVTAYRIVLHVDNNPCFGQILPVLGANVTIDPDCGFYEYEPGATVNMRFRASHPHGFATFTFSTVRGLSNPVEAAGASGSVTVVSVNGFSRVGTLFTKNGIPVVGAEGASMLEGGCDRAAFASTLYVNALATDGWSELDYLNASPAPIAFALVPEE